MRNFKPSEFDCPDCGSNLMDTVFLDKIDFAREVAGVPFNINSGFRCEAHNRAVGGSSTSSHPLGLACDIAARDSRSRFKIIDGLIRAGIKRIGIAKTFIHADDDPDKGPEVAWLY